MTANPILVLSMATLIAGCAAGTPTVSGPPAYQEGYDNGCSSGYFFAGNKVFRHIKDTARFNSDQEYKTGWEDGFAKCRSWPL